MTGNAHVRFNRLAWALFLVILVAQVWVVFSPVTSLLNWFTTDDAFYYYKVAQNIAEGRGSTFDGMNLTNGYHPLWMLICVPVFALARFDLILPLRLLVFISIGLTAGTSLTIYRLLASRLPAPLAWLAAAAWAFLPRIAGVATLQGMESGLNIFFVALLLERTAALRTLPLAEQSPRRMLGVGLLAGLAVLSRLDNVFVALAVGLWLLFPRLSLGYFSLSYLAAAFAAVFGAFFLRLGFVQTFPEFLPGLYAMLALASVLQPAAAYLLGLSTPGSWKKVWRAPLAALGGAALAGGLVALLSARGVLGGFPRAVILWDALLTAILYAVIYLTGSRLPGRSPGASPWTEVKASLGLWLRRGLAYGLPVLLLLGGYMLWSHVTFGTSSPVSGQIKQWWGSIPDTAYGRPVSSLAELLGLERAWKFAFSIFPLGGQGPLAVLAWSLILALGWWMGGRKAGLGAWPLLTACLLQVLHYHGGYYVGMRPWYWVNELLLLVMLAALALDGFWMRIATNFKSASRRSGLVVLLCILALLVNFEVWLGRNFPLVRPEDDVHIYIAEARWLEANTPAGSTIGMSGGGTAAYFMADRTLVNLDGLINSTDYFQQVKNGRGREAVDGFGLDYVYGNAYLLTSSNPYYNTLKDRLTPLGMMNDQTLFRYANP